MNSLTKLLSTIDESIRLSGVIRREYDKLDSQSDYELTQCYLHLRTARNCINEVAVNVEKVDKLTQKGGKR